MNQPLTDPIAIAIKTVADSVLAGDEALLGVIREVIKKMASLEARILELELINSSKTSLRT